jgi:hypothetical protein
MVAQMTVGFHAKRATVLVAKPPRHRGNVHARLDAARGEQMPQVVVSDAFHTGQLRGTVN